MSSRFFRVRSPRERIYIAGCLIAFVVIWITIFAQLSTPDQSVEKMLPEIDPATLEMSPTDSAVGTSPLFDRGWAPDRAYSYDPFWPLASLEHTNAAVTIDSPSTSNALSRITFYGTLQRNQQLLGLIRDGNGRSRLVSVGDSLREGRVETITECKIGVRIAGVTCLLERRP